MILVLFLWLAPMFIAMRIGAGKGRRTEGFCWGLFLGWIGVAAIAMRGPSRDIQTMQMAVVTATVTAAAIAAARDQHPSSYPPHPSLPPPQPENRRSS